MKRWLFLLIMLIVVIVVACSWSEICKIVFREPSGADHRVVANIKFESSESLDKWEEKVLARNKTEYTVTDFKEKKCVKAFSDDSASAFFYKKRLLYERWPYVSWYWIVEKFPDKKREEVLDKKKEFDFGAQVYVVFHSKFFLKTKAIQYVWTKDLPVGSVADSPYTKNVKIVVLQSGLQEEWQHEYRNIRDDYRLLFGEELNKDVDAIAFMTDSDSTDSQAVAYYAGFVEGYVEKIDEEKSKEEYGLFSKVKDRIKLFLSTFDFVKNKERSGHQVP